MTSPEEQTRLSRIETLWTQMFRLGTGQEKPDGPPRDLVLRYYGAVYRYLLGIVRDEDLAMDLTQEFAGRFLRGDFKKANPQRGRFRDFLKVSLRNLVMDHYRKQKVARIKGLRPLVDEGSVAASEPDPNASDEVFVCSFREEVLAKTWDSLAEADRSSGKSHNAVLRFKTQNPDMASADMAQELSRQLGKDINDVAMRQTLHRARAQFADLLLAEVSRTLGTPSVDELTQELVELRLLEYCKSALDRRAKEAQDS